MPSRKPTSPGSHCPSPSTTTSSLTFDELAYTIREAFHIARTGRPGPVLIDIPKDVQIEETEFIYPEDPIVLPGYKPATGASEDQVNQAMAMIAAAERPVILAGQGVLMSGAMSELKAFVEKMQIPVALTLLGKGGIPESHPLVLGMMGMHGDPYVNQAIQESDLLLAFGMRFDDRVTGNLKTYAQKARKIHVDVDASEINKNVPVDLGIIGDLKTVLNQVTPRLAAKRHSDWLEQISEWQDDSYKRDIINKNSRGKLYAAHVIHDLWQLTDGDAIVVTDVGQHQMWEAQYYPHIRPHTLITSGGAGTMGFGMPAAVGAKMSMPDEEVWSISGDGGFQMTLFELATAVQEKVPLNIAIINNQYLGMVRQWQELFFEERYIATPISHPDFVKLAEAYGIPAVRVTKRDEIEEAVAKARHHNDGPFLIEFVVEKMDIVYPMVPSGADLADMIRRPKAENAK
jgi:acetolactate synthase-1/2/3 large subunit